MEWGVEMDPVIQFEDVSYIYPSRKFSLKNISFEVQQGEIFAVTGTNGAGKTTLLRLMVGLLMPNDGEIHVLKLKVEKKNLPQIRTKVGYVFQNPEDQLFAPTIYEDVAFGPRNLGRPEEQVDKVVKEWLELVGLEEYADHSPYELSFGQKKRAAIAGVFAMNPELLLLDEPFANLDLPSTIALMRLLTQIVIGKNVTLIFSSHDCNLIENWSDNMLVLNRGHNIFFGNSRIGLQKGTIKKILGDPEELKKVYRKHKPTSLEFIQTQ